MKIFAEVKKVPEFVRYFLIRASIIFICWTIIYQIFLLPKRIIDKPLSQLTAKATNFVYNLFNPGSSRIVETLNEGNFKSVFYIHGERAIGIADGCNGLELFILFAGYLFCLREATKKKLIYLVSGIAIIFTLNILRCVMLAWLNLHYINFADFAHHYLFKLIVYGVIFYIWLLYSKRSFQYE